MIRTPPEARQIALPLDWTGEGDGTFVLTTLLETALAPLTDASLWGATGAVLVGEERSGKSVIARWIGEQSGAEVIDDADSLADDALFHRWNGAKEAGRACLMVARMPPGDWAIALPDLKSRIASALLVELPPPDEALMRALIEHHLARHGATIPEDALGYAMRRIERSHAAAEGFALAANARSLAEKRPITLPLVRALVEDLRTANSPGLFDKS